MYSQPSVRVGVGIGAFGVAFVLATTTLLVLVPQELLSPAASRGYVATWSRPVMLVGEAVLVYGLPLATVAAAFHLTRTDHAPRQVLVGFVAGGLVFGLGEALLGEVLTGLFATDPAVGQTLVGHVSDVVTLGGRMVLGAAVGVVAAVAIRMRR